MPKATVSVAPLFPQTQCCRAFDDRHLIDGVEQSLPTLAASDNRPLEIRPYLELPLRTFAEVLRERAKRRAFERERL